jgi:hypothetical protein
MRAFVRQRLGAFIGIHWMNVCSYLVKDQIYVLFLSYGLMEMASLHCHHRFSWLKAIEAQPDLSTAPFHL